jgi:hypothetical protein
MEHLGYWPLSGYPGLEDACRELHFGKNVCGILVITHIPVDKMNNIRYLMVNPSIRT